MLPLSLFLARAPKSSTAGHAAPSSPSQAGLQADWAGEPGCTRASTASALGKSEPRRRTCPGCFDKLAQFLPASRAPENSRAPQILQNPIKQGQNQAVSVNWLIVDLLGPSGGPHGWTLARENGLRVVYQRLVQPRKSQAVSSGQPVGGLQGQHDLVRGQGPCPHGPTHPPPASDTTNLAFPAPEGQIRIGSGLPAGRKQCKSREFHQVLRARTNQGNFSPGCLTRHPTNHLTPSDTKKAQQEAQQVKLRFAPSPAASKVACSATPTPKLHQTPSNSIKLGQTPAVQSQYG